MAGPMYYFPGNWGNAITDVAIKNRIEECGLTDILGDATYHEQTVTSGPDNGPGLVIAARITPPGRVPNFGYYPEDQTWVLIKAKNYWIGLQKSSLPMPADLQRNCKLLHDYSIRLADGNEWSVMTVHPFRRAGSIPRIGCMGDDGDWEWEVNPKFAKLVEDYEQIFSGKENTINGWTDLAIDTLKVNYRINKELAMTMRLLEMSHGERIVELAMDLPEMKAYDEAKKRGLQRSDVSVTNAGDVIPNQSQDSNQPTVISTG